MIEKREYCKRCGTYEVKVDKKGNIKCLNKVCKAICIPKEDGSYEIEVEIK